MNLVQKIEFIQGEIKKAFAENRCPTWEEIANKCEGGEDVLFALNDLGLISVEGDQIVNAV